MATGSWGGSRHAWSCTTAVFWTWHRGLTGETFPRPHLCSLAGAVRAAGLGGRFRPFSLTRCLGIETLPPGLVWVHLRVIHYADLVKEADNSMGPMKACSLPALLFVDRRNDWLNEFGEVSSLLPYPQVCIVSFPCSDFVLLCSWTWLPRVVLGRGSQWIFRVVLKSSLPDGCFPCVTGCVCAIEDAVIVPSVNISQCIFS